MRKFKILLISAIGVAAIYIFAALSELQLYLKRRRQMKRVRTD